MYTIIHGEIFKIILSDGSIAHISNYIKGLIIITPGYPSRGYSRNYI